MPETAVQKLPHLPDGEPDSFLPSPIQVAEGMEASSCPINLVPEATASSGLMGGLGPCLLLCSSNSTTISVHNFPAPFPSVRIPPCNFSFLQTSPQTQLIYQTLIFTLVLSPSEMKPTYM